MVNRQTNPSVSGLQKNELMLFLAVLSLVYLNCLCRWKMQWEKPIVCKGMECQEYRKHTL